MYKRKIREESPIANASGIPIIKNKPKETKKRTRDMRSRLMRIFLLVSIKYSENNLKNEQRTPDYHN